MAKLKSRLQCYGGFYFRDPQINTGQQLHDWAFNTLCIAVQRQRLGNPRFQLPTDMATIEAQVEEQNVARCVALGSRIADQFVMDASPAPAASFQPAASPRPQLSAVAGQVAKVIKNNAVLLDWLGAGGTPVDRTLAESRAKHCAEGTWIDGEGKERTGCPKNQIGDLARYFIIPAANAIRRALELRKDLNLESPYDSRLGVCDVCLCSNRLKMWTPIAHIKEKMPPEVLADLKAVTNPSGGCWVTKEIG